jgi:AhpD family alkylhydroperoxidase
MGMNDKIKELVAVGASITANCQPCLQYHTNKALEFGAEAGEVAEAIEMGKRVRKGASAKMDEFSSSVKETVAAPAAEKKSGCCGW